MTSVLEVLDSGTAYLEKRGVVDARRNMQYLMAHILDCKRMELYMNFDRPLVEKELIPLRENLKKRGEGVPLQYLLGTVSFCGREFSCDKRALIPRPETEELVEAVMLEVFPKPVRMLDMGCGSGVLGLSLAAELGGACENLLLVDISKEALSLAQENAQKLNIEAEFLQSDLFEQVEGEFNLIVANLPYVEDEERSSMQEELKHEPEGALFSGKDGLEHLRRFIPESYKKLSKGGLLGLEIGYNQAEEVAGMLSSSGFFEINIKKDLSGIPRFPLARRVD